MRKASVQSVDAPARLADYATAFDFLGRLSGGATNESDVVENAFELFSMIFAPRTMVYLSVRNGEPEEIISRSSVGFDLEEAKSSMLRLDTEHGWTPSGEGFDIAIGRGPTRQVIRIEGVQYVEHRYHYLNLALNIVPVLGLALSNARNFQLLHEEEEKLRSAIQARDRILAVVSHDLRNPLSSIALNADAIDRRCAGSPAEEPVCKHARSIRQSVKRMSRLIEDLLDVSRIEAGVFTVRTTQCSADELVNEAFRESRLQAEKSGIRLEERCHGKILLKCDRDRIIQVLCNLIGNALKFAPERVGVVTVECTKRADDMLFAVSDNGPGIRPEELSHVFDVYWQGRQKQHGGAGLGLAIVQGIVEAHSGRIWVESTWGHGATFFFTIPGA